MSKYLKLNIIIVILALTMFCTVSAAGEWDTYDYSRFNNSTYIYDIGGNFDNVDLNYYNEILKNMKSTYGITYTFIIVNDYNDSAWDLAACIREYAGYSKDYITALISVKNRDLAVFTLGRGQQVMNDNFVEGMLDALVISLKTDDWDGALITFTDLAKKMTDSYNADSNSVADRFGNKIYASIDYYTYSQSFDIVSLLLWFFIGGVIIAFIFTLIEWGKHKPVKKAWNADFYVKTENVKMSVVEDRYLRSHETRVKVSSSSSGGGGGSRGGGSTRTGSSGRSGGGGSRKF
jgi:uncharacterized protein